MSVPTDTQPSDHGGSQQPPSTGSATGTNPPQVQTVQDSVVHAAKVARAAQVQAQSAQAQAQAAQMQAQAAQTQAQAAQAQAQAQAAQGLADHTNKGRFSQNIAPILAVIALVMSFGLFLYFVWQVNQPIDYLVKLQDLYAKLSLLRIELAKTQDPVLVEAFKREEATLLGMIEAFKTGMELVKDQRGAMKDFILYILGVLSSIVTTIFGYYFGSSSSSARKDEIRALTGNQPGPSTDTPPDNKKAE